MIKDANRERGAARNGADFTCRSTGASRLRTAIYNTFKERAVPIAIVPHKVGMRNQIFCV
jgi:Tfp pilus assembly pilus retraction ATPase PilT